MSSDTAETLIRACAALKQGSREVVVHYDPDYNGLWTVGIGNPCSHVRLGESDPEFSGEGPTLEAAARALHERLLVCGGRVPDPRSPAEAAFDTFVDSLSDAEFTHYYTCLREAYPLAPGEIGVSVVRASMIQAAAIRAPTIAVGGLPRRITGAEVG